MARHTQHNDRKRGRTVVAASFAIAGLAVTGAGVYAGLNAQATGTQAVDTGTIELVLAEGVASAGFGQTFDEMAPGDTRSAYVDVTDGGSLDAQDLTLSVTGTTLLTTDATRGLQVTVESCSIAWLAGACGDVGGAVVVVASVPVATLASTPSMLVPGAVAKTAYHYRVVTELPDQNETTLNGVLPTSTIQGLSTDLTFTFDETQRDATAS